jgi:Cysteine-rich domain
MLDIPMPDPKILARRPDIIAGHALLVPSDALIVSEEERRAYETDGTSPLAARRSAPFDHRRGLCRPQILLRGGRESRRTRRRDVALRQSDSSRRRDRARTVEDERRAFGQLRKSNSDGAIGGHQPRDQSCGRSGRFIVKDVPEGHICCGSAGTYNVLQPEIAVRLRDRKISNIARTEPQIIATGNVGSAVQLASGTSVPVVHTVELIDWATGGPAPDALHHLLVCHEHASKGGRGVDARA